jgi:hypothetical protein
MGCSSNGPERDAIAESDGSLRGELTVYVSTLDDGTARTEYSLRADGNEDEERRLLLREPPDLPSGTRIKVWGVDTGDQIEVTEIVIDERAARDVGSIQKALVNGTKQRDRTFAWVFVDVGGGAGTLTATEAKRRLFGTNPGDNSTKQYFLETSYGVQDIGGDVFGPISYSLPSCTDANIVRMSSLRSQVGTFDHYLWYFSTRVAGCSWAGKATVGSPDAPSRDTWYNGSSSCIVLVQEPGHNFGMQHSSSFRCGSQPFADNPSSCTHDEYGDRYDTMGYGNCFHMNAWQKAYQGWFGGCNSVKVGVSGTYTLHPLETKCNGIQVLQIPMPKARPYTFPAGGGTGGGALTLRYYYLELRTNVGFDSTLPSTPFVLVRVADEYRNQRQPGQHTWILDMQPSTTGANSFDGMRAGSTFTDPAGGTSFTVESISQTQASIKVEIANGSGSSTCIDGTTLTAPGPATCGDGAGGSPGTGGSAGTGSAGTTGAAGTGGTGGNGGSGGGAGAGGTGGGGGEPGGASGTGALGGAGGSAAGSAGNGGTGAAGQSGASGAGAGGLGATGGNTSAGSGQGAAAGRASDPRADDYPGVTFGEDPSGCTCRTVAPRSSPSSLLLLLGVFGALGRRRAARR